MEDSDLEHISEFVEDDEQDAPGGTAKKQHRLAPWQFKKGQSGNPKGRPPGKSLKERAKVMLNSMTEEEEQEFLQGIDKRTIWEMAEGKPTHKTDIGVDKEGIKEITEFLRAMGQ